MAETRRVLAWLAPEQIELARAVVRAAELDLIAVGAPGRGHSVHVAAELETKACDDLRAALASADCDLVWIASPGTFGAASGADDASAVLAAGARGVKVATTEPIPAAALDLSSGGWTTEDRGIRAVDVMRLCPLARLSAPFREAAEVLESFGAIDTLVIEAWSGLGEGSLGARLYASLELLLTLMGEPETVEATYVTPGPGRAVHALPGESLRDLHGDMTANVRFADGRAGGLAASDRGGRWNRTITMIGPAGRLRISDDGFEWIGPSGDRLDHSRERSRGQKSQASYAATAYAESLSRMLDPAIPAPAPSDHATVLAIAQAALLSCRTGQGESPATIKRMVGTV